MRAGIRITGNDRIDGHGNGTAIDHRQQQGAPDAKRFQGADPGGKFQQEFVMGRQHAIVSECAATLKLSAKDTMVV